LSTFARSNSLLALGIRKETRCTIPTVSGLMTRMTYRHRDLPEEICDVQRSPFSCWLLPVCWQRPKISPSRLFPGLSLGSQFSVLPFRSSRT